MAGRLDGVGDHQERLPAFVDAVEQPQQAVGGLAVQRAGGLVCQQQLGLGDQGAGHSRPLLLSAGDLIGKFGQKRSDAQLVRQRLQTLLHFPIGRARQHQRQQDVVPQAEGVQQVEILKDEAQMVPAESGNFLLTDGGKLPVAQKNMALGGLVQRRQNVEQRGFAAAAFAHDGDELALLNGEIHVSERLHLLAAEAGGVDLFQMLDLEYGHCKKPPLRQALRKYSRRRSGASMALAYNSGLQPYKSVRFVRSGQNLKEISGER